MAEPVVLYPSVETDESDDLSQYLEDLVRQQTLPREIAKVFNRLPKLQLQKEAVTRYQASQTPAAWRIFRELQNPSSLSSLTIKSRTVAFVNNQGQTAHGKLAVIR